MVARKKGDTPPVQEVHEEAKADAIKQKLQLKKEHHDEPAHEDGRPVDQVIVHPHRLIQQNRIEQMYPETEVIYGAYDEGKEAALALAHSKGIPVLDHLPSNEIHAEIARVDKERQDAMEERAKPLVAQMLVNMKAYHNNQMHDLYRGHLVQDDLAREMIAVQAAEKVEHEE